MNCVTVCVTLAFAIAGQVPEPTDAGRKALAELIQHCVAAGGLRYHVDPTTKADKLALANVNRLKAALHGRRELLTADLRDTLVGTAQVHADDIDISPKLVLLQQFAEEMDDDRARAFAAHFAGRIARYRGQPREGREEAKAAVRLFTKIDDAFWRGNSWRLVDSQTGLAEPFAAVSGSGLDAARRRVSIWGLRTGRT